MAILLSEHDFEEGLPTFSIRELLEVGLNEVHEQGLAVYLRHKCNGVVRDTFLRDEIFGGDRTVSVQESIDSSVKRVQKLSSAARATVGQ
jgi:hypothetical protein